MRKGFTLLELLVVIAILGAMMGFVLLRLVGPERAARDSNRESDLKQYQTALEVYANRNSGVYPIRSSTVTAISLCGGGQPLGAIPCKNDPQGTNPYQYQSDSSGLRYVLWARLEKPTTPTYFVVCSNGTSCSTTTGIPPSGGNCPSSC